MRLLKCMLPVEHIVPNDISVQAKQERNKNEIPVMEVWWTKWPLSKRLANCQELKLQDQKSPPWQKGESYRVSCTTICWSGFNCLYAPVEKKKPFSQLQNTVHSHQTKQKVQLYNDKAAPEVIVTTFYVIYNQKVLGSTSCPISSKKDNGY